jgi:dolichol-phosphate mannosyltransferase
MLHWIKFNVVGVLGFALQSGALFLLTHNARPIGYLAATAMAVELAVLNNFVWHQRWTWRDRPSLTKGETLRRLAKFNVTAGLVSLVGNLVLMSILVGRFGLPLVGANLVTVAACSLVSFFLANRIAFDMDETSTSEPEAVATGQILNSKYSHFR